MRHNLMGVLALAVLALGGLATGAAAKGGGAGFTNFELAATPPQAAGTVCPGAGANCWNYAAEPQIRVAADGTFYGSSENGLGGGTDAWKSTDGGLHYATLLSPNGVSSANTTGFAPGGGDTDVAVAPARNAAGIYNAYVSSLTLANVDVSTSRDGGATWQLNPVGATISGDDRPWIAADGASKVCVSYHDVTTFNIDVNCSYDEGTTFTQLGDAIDVNHAWLIDDNQIGNLSIDASNHVVYQIMVGIANAAEAVGIGSPFHAVWIGVSTDGGQTFTDYPVYINPDTSVSYGAQFPQLSIDSAGNLYAVFCDGHSVYESYSTNHGQTWSKPVQVNAAGTTAIMPWSVAGSAGKLDVVYYQSTYRDASTPVDDYPSKAAWTVGFAQNLNATSGGSFSRSTASPVVHYGGVCLGGVTCTGNRDLYDDFGIAANPLTGLASIIYSDDQYTNDANDPPQPGCTPKRNNTIYCDHTAIAPQTSGKGIR